MLKKILAGFIALSIISTFQVCSFAESEKYLYNLRVVDKNYAEGTSRKYCSFELNGSAYLYSDSTGKIIKFIDSDRSPVFSPNGTQIAFSKHSDESDANKFEISIYDINTKTTKKIELENNNSNSITRINWINDCTICVEGHVNPSTSQFFVCDTANNKVKSYAGTFFFPTPDGYVLYKKNQPHFSEKGEPDTLCIDDQDVYKADDLSLTISVICVSRSSKKIAFFEMKNNESESEAMVLVTADIDFSKKKVSNVSKVKITNDMSGIASLYFDDDDNICLLDSDSKYQVDQVNKKWIKIKNTIPEPLKNEIDARMTKFKNAVTKKFKDDIKGDENKISSTINSTVNNAHWTGSSTIAEVYPELDSSIKVLINNKKITFSDVEPINKNSHVLIPLRAVMENMGAEVQWDDKTRTVTIKRNSTLIKLSIGSNKAYINGEEKEIDALAEILDGRTVVPIRFVSEGLGMKVKWVPETSSVIISE